MSYAKEYLEKGKRLILLNGKIPTKEMKDWVNLKLDHNIILSSPLNKAWVMDKLDLAIDIDPRNGGLQSWENFKKDFNFNPQITVNTAGGGHHIYLQLPEDCYDKKVIKNIKDYPGLDFIGHGGYVVIPGSVLGDKKYTWSSNFKTFDQGLITNRDVINLICKDVNKDVTSSLDYFDNVVSDYDINIQDIEKILKSLDNNMPNSDWVKVGQAIHDWDSSEIGLKLWEDWSIGGNTYKEYETEKRWSSFKNGSGVTVKTLFYMNKIANFDIHQRDINNLISKIKVASLPEIEVDLLKTIKKLNLNGFDLERVEWSLQSRFKDLLGKKPSIASVRDKLRSSSKQNVLNESGGDPWYKDWVYLANMACYFNKHTYCTYKSEAFNLLNGGQIFEEKGRKQKASSFVADNSLIDVIDFTAFLPWEKNLIVETTGGKLLNTYNPKSEPDTAKHMTIEAYFCIDRVINHFEMLFGEKNCNLLIEWFCHIVQYPGKKIRWAPVLYTPEGFGKGLLIELFIQCLGSSNVGRVQPSQIASQFNSWITDKIIIILEEINIRGHNRHESLNALKTLISEDRVQINKKGIPQYEVPNTANLIAFTNFKDSVPVSDGDRRYWMLSAELSNITEIEKNTGQDHEKYFRELFDDVRTYGPEIRKWALEYPLTDVILKQQRAPMTDLKKYVISTEENSFHGLIEVKDLIEKGGKYYNKNCVSSSDLFENLMFDNPELTLNPSSKNQILKKLGFLAHPDPVKIGGKTRRIWVKRFMTNKEIRLEFGEKD